MYIMNVATNEPILPTKPAKLDSRESMAVFSQEENESRIAGSES